MHTSIKRLSKRLKLTPPKCNSACGFLKEQKQSPWKPSSIPDYSGPLRKERSLSVSPCLSFAVTFYRKLFFVGTSVFVFLLDSDFLCYPWFFMHQVKHKTVWKHKFELYISILKDLSTQITKSYIK